MSTELLAKSRVAQITQYSKSFMWVIDWMRRKSISCLLILSKISFSHLNAALGVNFSPFEVRHFPPTSSLGQLFETLVISITSQLFSRFSPIDLSAPLTKPCALQCLGFRLLASGHGPWGQNITHTVRHLRLSKKNSFFSFCPSLLQPPPSLKEC